MLIKAVEENKKQDSSNFVDHIEAQTVEKANMVDKKVYRFDGWHESTGYRYVKRQKAVT